MQRTIFEIAGMDCIAEERLVRLALDDAAHRLEFDLGERRVAVVHDGAPDHLLQLLEPLRLRSRIVTTHVIDDDAALVVVTDVSGRGALAALLAINATMFLVELVCGLVYQSTALIADSLDMLADAAVYALSLYAVGKALVFQARAARFSGYVQLILASGVLIEVVRRIVVGSEPEGGVMMAIALVALFANVVGLALLSKHRRGGLHMQASWIFTSTDVIANVGVVAAGILVTWTDSPWPDLIIGLSIGVLVLFSALKILRVSRKHGASPG